MLRFLGDLLFWFVRHWLLTVPLVLGFVAVWFLLPQARQRPLRWAIGAGVAAVLLAGPVAMALGEPVLGQPTGQLLPDLLFYFFAGFAVLAGVCMITQRNPVHAALWFAVVILSTCGLFLLQSAPFLAAATVIIYAGAIIVMFLFVVMFAQQTGLAAYDWRSQEPFLASLAGFILLGALLYVLQVSYATPVKSGDQPAPRAEVNRALSTDIQQIAVKLREAEDLLQHGAPEEQIASALYLDGSRPLFLVLEQRAGLLPDKEKQAAELGEAWRDAKRDGDPAERRRRMRVVLAAARELTEDLQIGFAGSPLSQIDRQSSSYVTNLGRSVFGDYLWGVELAGTLLLVAAIGAIVIAARRRESEARAGTGANGSAGLHPATTPLANQVRREGLS